MARPWRHSPISVIQGGDKSLIWKKMVLGRVPRFRGKGKRFMWVSISNTQDTLEHLLVEAPPDENLDHLGMVG